MPRSITYWDDSEVLWDDPNVDWDGVFVPDKGAEKFVSNNHTSRIALTPIEDDREITVSTTTDIDVTPIEDDTEL